MESEDISTHLDLPDDDGLESFFRERGEIFIFEEITDEAALRVVQEIRYLDAILPPDDPIRIFINSDGGSIDAAVAIIDEMHRIKRTIETVAQGRACSCAAYILAFGSKGRRYATANSIIMLHPATIETDPDYVAQQHRYIEFAKRIHEIFTNVLGRVCGKGRNLKKFREDISDGLWMTSKEAKRFGVIDEVIA